jgi:ER lumen protein retaining receptor
MFPVKVFRFLGDALAITSRIAILKKISNTNSLSGISLKTQLIYLVVYLFRYLDLLSSPFIFISKIKNNLSISLFLYNSIFKVSYISFQIYLISQFFNNKKYTYSKKFDTFPVKTFLAFSLILAIFLKDSIVKDDSNGFFLSIFFASFSYVKELLYTASLILESLAILPQLVVSQDSGECEKLVAISITCLGLYRLSYFIYFYLSLDTTKIDTLLIVSSLIQSILYVDFYRVYYGMISK